MSRNKTRIRRKVSKGGRDSRKSKKSIVSIAPDSKKESNKEAFYCEMCKYCGIHQDIIKERDELKEETAGLKINLLTSEKKIKGLTNKLKRAYDTNAKLLLEKPMSHASVNNEPSFSGDVVEDIDYILKQKSMKNKTRKSKSKK